MIHSNSVKSCVALFVIVFTMSNIMMIDHAISGTSSNRVSTNDWKSSIKRFFNQDDDNALYRDPLSLYMDAFAQIAESNYKNADKKFDTLRRRFPSSEYVEKSLIMQVFIYYIVDELTKIPEAVEMHEKFYPKSKYSSYMQYMNIMAIYKKTYLSTRNLDLPLQALQMTINMMSRYDDKYTALLAEKRGFLTNLQVMQMLRIGEHYQAIGHLFPAINRYEDALQMPLTQFHPILLARISECYKALRFDDIAEIYRNILHERFPDFPSKIYRTGPTKGALWSDTWRDDVAYFGTRLQWRRW